MDRSITYGSIHNLWIVIKNNYLSLKYILHEEAFVLICTLSIPRCIYEKTINSHLNLVLLVSSMIIINR